MPGIVHALHLGNAKAFSAYGVTSLPMKREMPMMVAPMPGNVAQDSKLGKLREAAGKAKKNIYSDTVTLENSGS